MAFTRLDPINAPATLCAFVCNGVSIGMNANTRCREMLNTAIRCGRTVSWAIWLGCVVSDGYCSAEVLQDAHAAQPHALATATTRRAVIAGGGGSASVGTLQWNATIGQAHAAVDASEAADVLLQGGFWTVKPSLVDPLFSSDFE